MKTRILYVFTFFLVMISAVHSQLIEGYCEVAHISSPAENWDYEYKLGGEFSIVVNAQTRKPYLASLKNSHLVFRINPDGAHDENDNPIPFATIKAVVQRAIDAWNNVTSSYVTFEVSDIPYSGEVIAADGVSCIGFRNTMEVLGSMFWQSSTPSQNPLSEVDIRLISYNRRKYSLPEPFRNVYMRWNTNITYPEEYELYNNPIPPSYTVEPIGPIDMQDVITHELGHAIGLWHPPFAFTYHTMRPTNYSVPNWWEKTWRRTLENGDKAGKIYETPDFTTNTTQTIPHVLLSSQTTININGSFTIPLGYIFEVEPGVTFKIDFGKSIISYGKIKAIGTSLLPITFTSSSGTLSGEWGSIYFDGTGAASSQLSYCNVQYGFAIECHSGANVTIDHCTILNNDFGILCYSSNPEISNNLISNSLNAGIQNTMNANPRIENNTITNDVIANNSIGVYLYGGQGYINSNTISGFHVGVYPRAGSYLGAWSGNNYNYTPSQNNIMTGNTYGVVTYDNSWAFMGRYDYNTEMVHGGNNWIENNATYDLVAGAYTSLYGEANWYGYDYEPTSLEGANGYLPWWALNTNPWGDSPSAVNQKQIPSVSQNTTSAVPTSQRNKSLNGEDKLFEEAVSDHLNKSYGDAQKKYKQLFSSKKYSKSALVLLSRLFVESNDDNGLANFEDLKSNPSKNTLDAGNIPITTNLLANMHGYKGNYEKALALYDDVVKKYPNSVEERNARVQKIYYSIEGKKDQTGAQQMLNELLAIYKTGDDIDMIKNLVNHSALSGENTKPFLKKSKIEEYPKEYSLLQNYPNPFNPTTTIAFSIPQAVNVTLKIFDALGRDVATLVNEFKSEGAYTVQFSAKGGYAYSGNGSSLSNGVYFYRLQAGSYVATRKFVLMK